MLICSNAFNWFSISEIDCFDSTIRFLILVNPWAIWVLKTLNPSEPIKGKMPFNPLKDLTTLSIACTSLVKISTRLPIESTSNKSW